MAKKQRKQQPKRVVSPATPASVVTASTVESPAPVQLRRATPPPPIAAKSRTGAAWCDFQERYRHVNSELRQIGIIAGSFLVVLLVLAFILR